MLSTVIVMITAKTASLNPIIRVLSFREVLPESLIVPFYHLSYSETYVHFSGALSHSYNSSESSLSFTGPDRSIV
jgi:hypothetical protein